MSSRDDSSGLAIILALGLGAAGLWVHFQVVALSTVVHLDTATTYSVLKRFLVLAFATGLVGYLGFFKKLWTFLGLGLFLCLAPALDYWSVVHITEEFALDIDPSWYGRRWVQIVIALVLLGIGTYFSTRDD